MRASITTGAVYDEVMADEARCAAWMSRAGSNRVNVVQRKFIGLRDGARGFVGHDQQRPARKRRVRGEPRGGVRVVGIARARRRQAAAAEDAHVA